MMQPRDQSSRRVLLVESDAGLRRVLALGLRQRGFDVAEARALGDAWELSALPPAVVILDVGLGPSSEWTLLRALRAHRTLGEAPLVLLAWDCPADPALTDGRASPLVCLAKPFDARALFDAVEGLALVPVHVPAGPLVAVAAAAGAPEPAPDAGVSGATAGEGHAGAEALPVSPPSISPLVTAAGALLAVFGFLIHPAFVVAGIVVILAAVLWWLREADEPAGA
jgi:CheY-like chemotaxis protein